MVVLALFLSHLGMLIYLCESSSGNSPSLKVLSIVFISISIVVEMVTLIFLYVVGVTNIDQGDGEDTVISTCVSKTTLRSWNNAVTVCTVLLMIISAVAMVTMVTYLV